MKIPQELYELLQKKNWYRYICDNNLVNCFDTKTRELLITQKGLKQIINKFKIFRYSYDATDYKIFRLLHNFIEHEEDAFLNVIPVHSWLTAKDILSCDVNVETQPHITWNAALN